MKLNIFDSHVHTDSSSDADHSLVYICEKAIQNNIMGLAVTDHYECATAERWNCYQRIKQSMFQVEKARASFGGEIRLTKGVELGEGHRFPIEVNRVMSITDYDFVLGSVHHIEGIGDPYELDFDDPKIIVADVLKAYYRDNLAMTKWNGFDSLAHLGYTERYIWGKYRIPTSYAPYMDTIEEILKLLIANGKALEVNTSGYRQGIGKSFPDAQLIKLYRQMGGELVTIGSDAHRAEDVGADMEVAMDMLLDIGFEYFAFYSKREPVMLKIM